MKKAVLLKCISILVLFSLVIHVFPVAANKTNTCIISKELQETMAETEPDSTIPVYIWYNDIDHQQVERAVESALGFSKDEIIEKAAEMITDAERKNIEERKADSLSTIDEVNEFLKLTKTIREAETQLTNQFIAAKRNMEKTAYKEAASEFCKNVGLSNQEIRFQSRYAPMLIADLTVSRINDIYNHKIQMIMDICKKMEPVDCNSLTDWETIKNITRIDKIYSDVQLSGEGINVGIVETSNVYLSSTLPEYPSSRFHIVGIPYYQSTNDGNHANNTAKILCSNYGIAYEATCYSVSVEKGAYANYDYHYSFFGAIELLLDYNVTVINCSFGYLTNEESYGYYDKWVDHLSHTHHVSFVASAGNNDGNHATPYSYLLSPAKAYNVITVGGYKTLLTETTNDDIMYADSCYNSNGGCAKPDVLAPNDMFGGGTSSSAPYISGIIALMIEARPSLAIYPELIKAILIASCHRKVLPANNNLPETMYQGLTEVQGAGVADPFTAICIICNGNYGMCNMSSNTATSSTRIIQPAYDSNGLNFTIAWPRINTIIGDHVTGTVTLGDVEDLNLKIKNGNSVAKYALSNNQSTQMVYITPSSTNVNYTIEVDWVSNGSESVRYSYAWSLNKERYQHTQQYEGLYFLRNQNSNKYLNLNPSTLTISQESFTGGANQMWLVKLGPTLKFFFGNANTTADYYLTASSSAVGSVYPATVTSSEQYSNYIFLRNEGNYNIRHPISGINYSLGISNGASQSGAQAVWASYSATSSSQRWVFCKCAYQRADVDLDGNITSADARLILRYSTNLETPTIVQRFLADCNGNGSITSEDARIALRISVGLE